jgi:hypothetical protein
VKIDGKTHVGPFRMDKEEAEEDLREAKEAQTIELMETRIAEIKLRSQTTTG